MRKFQAVTFVVFLSVSSVLGSIASALCEEKRAFDQVRAQTKAFFGTGAPLSEAQNRLLGRGLSQLNLLIIFPVLAANNQTMHAPFLNRILDEFAVLQLSGRRNAQVLSARNIEKAAQIFEELCASPQLINQASIGVNKRLILERFEFNFTNPFRGWTGADARSYFNLSLVFFVLLGLISLIVFFWKAYVLVFPFLDNRRYCKIPAVLIVSDIEIAGHITILGSSAARFVPLFETVETGVLNIQTTQGNVRLVVGTSEFLASLKSAVSEFSIITFNDKLDREIMNELYQSSEIQRRFDSYSELELLISSWDIEKRPKQAGIKTRKAPAL